MGASYVAEGLNAFIRHTNTGKVFKVLFKAQTRSKTGVLFSTVH